MRKGENHIRLVLYTFSFLVCFTLEHLNEKKNSSSKEDDDRDVIDYEEEGNRGCYLRK
jgi:hypothetical protein